MKRWDMVLVSWRDIVGNSGWHKTSKHNAEKSQPCLTLGWFLSQDEQNLKVCSSRFVDKKTIGDITTIPVGCVVAVTAVRCD